MNHHFFHAVAVQIHERDNVSNCTVAFDILVFQVLPENRLQGHISRPTLYIIPLTDTGDCKHQPTEEEERCQLERPRSGSVVHGKTLNDERINWRNIAITPIDPEGVE